MTLTIIMKRVNEENFLKKLIYFDNPNVTNQI
jgi:hypothetical protein